MDALPRSVALALHRFDPVSQRQQLRDLVAVAPVSESRWNAARIGHAEVLEPVRARSTGESPVRSPHKRADVA
jgi:hypothetical protein